MVLADMEVLADTAVHIDSEAAGRRSSLDRRVLDRSALVGDNWVEGRLGLSVCWLSVYVPWLLKMQV